MSRPASILTLENPTRDFIHANYKKEDLQKQCRELGISKVWVNKDKLIDMILENHRNNRPTIPESNVQVRQSTELDETDIFEILEELREGENIRDKEINDLKELLHSAQVTINKLSDRVSLLEEKVTLFQGTPLSHPLNPFLQGSSSSRPKAEGTLLLGDTNLSPVRASDLSNNCSVRTIKGANIDLLKCWISEKLQWVPSNCILYCGLQDILDKSTPSDIFDRLGSLIAELKQINENMNIHICELAPIPNVCDYDEHINNFNNQVATWSTENGVSTIKTNLQFRLGTGEVDRMCYNDTGENDNFLNRFGIIRLLNVISKSCPSLKLHENWETIMSQGIPTSSFDNSRRINFNENNHEKTNNKATRYIRSHHSHIRGKRISRTNTRQFPSQPNRRYYEDSSFRTFHRGQRNFNERRRNYHSHRSYQGWANQQREGPQNYDHHRTCFNCGENNHTLPECRYDHRIKCNHCNEFGHKTRLCPYSA